MRRLFSVLKGPLGPIIAIAAITLAGSVNNHLFGAFVLGSIIGGAFDPVPLTIALVFGFVVRRWWHVLVLAAVPIAIELTLLRPEIGLVAEGWEYRRIVSIGGLVCLVAGVLGALSARVTKPKGEDKRN